MCAMVEGKWFQPGADAAEAFAIREKVFGRGRDALDDESWNVLVWYAGEPAATGRLWWREGAFWLGDIAVLPELRGKRLGDLTLRLLLFKAESHAARLLRLVSPVDVTGFFAKLGFQPEGEEADGRLSMLLRGEDLCLDTCKGCKKDCPNRRS
ncbi:MAG: GNAT family N-acetyltransferase [Clostridiales bacterium]|nr:GNAT family N-acetyltransferase [Clostridiales bacterium]